MIHKALSQCCNVKTAHCSTPHKDESHLTILKNAGLDGYLTDHSWRRMCARCVKEVKFTAKPIEIVEAPKATDNSEKFKIKPLKLPVNVQASRNEE